MTIYNLDVPLFLFGTSLFHFSVLMYGCESWTIKKAEHWRTDAFELWCWKRLLRLPWTARRSNQFILKKISPKCSLEGLMLKLKLQYSGHLMWRTDSLENTLMLGKIEGRRRRGWKRMILLDGITDSIDMSLSKLRKLVTEKLGVLQSTGLQRVSYNWTDWLIHFLNQDKLVLHLPTWMGSIKEKIIAKIFEGKTTNC